LGANPPPDADEWLPVKLCGGDPAAGGAALRGAPFRRAGRKAPGPLAGGDRGGLRAKRARLAPLADFNGWIGHEDTQKRILLSPRASEPLPDWARRQPPQAVTVLIGPAGGYTEQEEDAAIARGAIALSIGPRVLRTETAGIAAAAALNALWGGM
jgi:16S rRNA (uracil1498-N3)-methyltransferase